VWSDALWAACVAPCEPVYPHDRLPEIGCDTATGKATSVISVVGTENMRVGSAQVPTTHVHMDQTATGTSTSKGSIDLWLVTASGLPARAQTQQEGSQHVLGQVVTYHEAATFTLLSLTPRR